MLVFGGTEEAPLMLLRIDTTYLLLTGMVSYIIRGRNLHTFHNKLYTRSNKQTNKTRSISTPTPKSLRSLPRQQQRLPGLDGITLLHQNLLHSRPNRRWVSPDGNLELHGL